MSMCMCGQMPCECPSYDDDTTEDRILSTLTLIAQQNQVIIERLGEINSNIIDVETAVENLAKQAGWQS